MFGGRKREESVYAIQNDNSTRLAVCNIKAAGVGLNLTAPRHLAFFEFWWNPAAHDQAESRAHRIGQTREVFIHYWIAKNTIEEKMCRILEERQNMINESVDRFLPIPTDNFNIHSDLIKELKREGQW